MNGLSPYERRALKDLADELVAATEGTYWLNQIRDTAIELRDRINIWLNHTNTDETEI